MCGRWCQWDHESIPSVFTTSSAADASHLQCRDQALDSLQLGRYVRVRRRRGGRGGGGSDRRRGSPAGTGQRSPAADTVVPLDHFPAI